MKSRVEPARSVLAAITVLALAFALVVVYGGRPALGADVDPV